MLTDQTSQDITDLLTVIEKALEKIRRHMSEEMLSKEIVLEEAIMALRAAAMLRTEFEQLNTRR